MNIKLLLGKRIRELRRARGYTQERLAEKTGLSVAFIGLTERGQECPSIKTADRIAKALDVTLSELFDFSEEKPDRRGIDKAIEGLAVKLKRARVDNARFVLDITERILERLEGGSGGDVSQGDDKREGVMS